MTNYTKVFLKKNKEEALERFHPWVFSGAISHSDKEPVEGEIVDVYSYDKNFIARGHCALGSIAVRVLTFVQEDIDQSWWDLRIKSAYNTREILGLINDEKTNCYRLVHGEGDLLPGLIVDIYDKCAVIQAHSIGMFVSMENVVRAISNCFGDKITTIYNKSEATLPGGGEQIGCVDGVVYGEDISGCIIKENDAMFNVNWRAGQKTGFFIDQRENRSLVGLYSKGKRVLNTFCYTGGFSVYALLGGAEYVESVDSSAKAVELSDKNVLLNGQDILSKHKGVVVDALEYLRDINKDDFDVIILDPPAFAKHHKAVNNALNGYKRINANAIKNIKSGGVIFTFSCSQAISKDQFRNAVFSAAAIAKRNVKILHQLSQSADHPINIYHPEGEYLKGLVVYVE